MPPKVYGYMFLICPCAILFFANMMVIVTDWNPSNLCKELNSAYKMNNFFKCLFKDTIPSVSRVFVAPIVWLIVSFARADYDVYAKVGPNPDNETGLVNTTEKQQLEDMMETTKTESQIIACGLLLGMVFVIFVVILLENCCGGKFKFIQHLVV